MKNTLFLLSFLFSLQTLAGWTIDDMIKKDVPICHRRTLHSEQELNQFFATYSKKTYDNQMTVRGVQFVNESPELVYRFMQLVSPVDEYDFMKAYVDIKNLKSLYAIPKDCKKVRCASEAIFGPSGPWLVYIIAKFDFNLSHVYRKDALPFTLDEIQSVLDAIDLLPSFLFPIEANRTLYKSKDDNGLTIANAMISLFRTWSKFPRAERTKVLIHEIGHTMTMYHYKWADNSEEWKSISGWTETATGKDIYKKGYMFVSEYAASNPAEDFAEAFAAYRLAPELLKNIDPRKYKYMKDVVFGGIEYINGCEDEAQAVAELRQEIAAYEKNFDYSQLNKISDQCIESFNSMVENLSKKDEYLSCLDMAAANLFNKDKGRYYGQLSPHSLFKNIEQTNRERLGFPKITQAIYKKEMSQLVNSIESLRRNDKYCFATPQIQYVETLKRRHASAGTQFLRVGSSMVLSPQFCYIAGAASDDRSKVQKLLNDFFQF